MCAMATPRRIQLTTLSNEATVPLICNSHVDEGLPKSDTVAAELPRSETAASDRIELVLFEPDEQRCPEFYYPELIKVKVTAETRLNTLDEVVKDNGRDELEALARKFEEKYGEPHTRRKDRWQDLVDMGYGYDDTDSFIDNSEAYDELVPASLSTKYGGFYINSGILHFRQAFDEGEENEMDDFEENVKFKKRKLKEGEGRTNKKRKDDLQPEKENAKNGTLPSMPQEEKKKKKKRIKPQSIDGMLRKFHKEKLQQLQMFSVKGSEGLPPPANWASEIQEEAPEEYGSADPLLTLIGSASADELLQAVKAVDQDFDLDGLLTEDHSTTSPDLENGDSSVVFQPAKAPISFPEGLPPMLELCIQELCQSTKEMEGERKMEALAPEINNVLLHVQVKAKELPDKVRSRIFSYLASQLSCKKNTLLKRAKKLHHLYLDDQLRDLLLRLEGAVTRTMPEQIDRFNGNCQAHSEARAAKLEAEKEQRAIDGSDEDDDKSGKRIFGPRKRFRWTEEIRELLGEVVRLKMGSYELEVVAGPNLEEYLRAFLEADVKPLWPKGWMQSRILLIESRRVHGHITGVVARKKSMIPKSKKVGSLSENTGEVQAVPTMKRPLGGNPAQRKRLNQPLIAQQAPQNAVCKPPLRAQASIDSLPPLPKLSQLRGEAGRSSFAAHQVSTEAIKLDFEGALEATRKTAATPQTFSAAERPVASPGDRPATDSGVGLAPKTVSGCGVASAPRRLPAVEKKPQKLTLVSPPAAAEGDTTAVQGVARLLTTTSFCKAPVSVAVAAVEGSCGDPALPTPSLSLQAAAYPNAPQTGALTNVVPLHALPFPGLAYAGHKPAHSHTCKDSMLSGPANGTFQYGLTHGIYSALCSSVLYPLSGPVSSSSSALHSLSPRTHPLGGSQIHAEGPSAQRKLH